LYSGNVQLPQQVSAVSTLFSSARPSLLSSSGRHCSVNSILSSTEKVSSERRASDVGLGSADKLSSGRDTKLLSSNNSYLVKREVMFSPIHEHNDEVSDTEIKESALNQYEMTIHFAPNMTDVVLSDEQKPIDSSCSEV